MRILSRPLKLPSYTFTCRCGAKLEAELSDIKKSGTDRNEAWVTFECPICKHETYVDTKVLPKEWNPS